MIFQYYFSEVMLNKKEEEEESNWNRVELKKVRERSLAEIKGKWKIKIEKTREAF